MPANATANVQPDPLPPPAAQLAMHASASRVAAEALTPAQQPRNHSLSSRLLPPELGQTWLAWQCRMVAGIIRGALYFTPAPEQLEAAVAVWPGEGEGQTQLQQVAAEALQQQRGIIRARQTYGPGNQRTCDLIACPLQVKDGSLAVVSVMISTRSEPQQHAVLQLLQWGGLWLETLVEQQHAAQREVGAFTLELMSAILGYAAAQTAVMAVVNRLAERLGCERVSIGYRQGLPLRLQALSHVASFDSRTQLVRRIEAAMEEAVDQRTTLIHPALGAPATCITRAHSELSEQQGQGAICTIPLPGRAGRTIGAITLERGASQPFDPESVAWCESLAQLIGPALEMKRGKDRSLWSHRGSFLRQWAGRLFGLSRLKLKLALLGATSVLVLLSVIDGDYQVTAPASIEGGVRQLLVAPQDGYVREAAVRAGDRVSQGQLIAALDDRTLQLEQRKWQSERNKIDKEYQEALATRDRTELSIQRAQRAQVDAELQLVEEKIARAQLRAPFDGVVLRGDFSQSLGSPVEQGQVLFEVAPLDSYRVVLEVDEHDVAGLDGDRAGQMVIAALPQSTFGLSLDQVIPVAVSGAGRNYFRVEAALDQPSDVLRPGMQGVAKVAMGRRKLLWIWTHAVFDRLRLWAWSVGL